MWAWFLLQRLHMLAYGLWHSALFSFQIQAYSFTFVHERLKQSAEDMLFTSAFSPHRITVA